jgi:amino acid transporter
MDTSIREVTSEATIHEKKKLRKELRLFDMIFILAAALIGVDQLGAFASNGGQALTWLIISAITYFIPYGLMMAELGSTFTQEGGFYEWCKLAGGRFFAAPVALLCWITNPIWVGGTLSVTAILAIKTLWFGNPQMRFGGSIIVDAVVSLLIALIFIWGTIWSVIISPRKGKLLSIYGTYVKIGLLVLFTILAIAYALSGHALGAHYTLVDFMPSSNTVAIITTIFPLLVFNWSGFEIQNGAGEEMHHPRRDVPRAIIRAGIITVVTMGVVIGTIFLTLPKDQLASATGFLAAYQIVVGILPGPIAHVLGWLVALAIVVSLANNGGAWVLGADRIFAIAALDRNAPAVLGRFSSKYGTPLATNIMNGIIATITVAASLLLTALVGGTSATLFAVVLSIALSTGSILYVVLFSVYLILHHKYPHVHRPYRVPGGTVGAWLVAILPLAYAVIASYFSLIPTDATISIFGVTRVTYELTVFVPLIIIGLLTMVFYIWGHLEKRNKDVVVELSFTEEETTKIVMNESIAD